jgi:hypothetical protein
LAESKTHAKQSVVAIPPIFNERQIRIRYGSCGGHAAMIPLL